MGRVRQPPPLPTLPVLAQSSRAGPWVPTSFPCRGAAVPEGCVPGVALGSPVRPGGCGNGWPGPRKEATPTLSPGCHVWADVDPASAGSCLGRAASGDRGQWWRLGHFSSGTHPGCAWQGGSMMQGPHPAALERPPAGKGRAASLERDVLSLPSQPWLRAPADAGTLERCRGEARMLTWLSSVPLSCGTTAGDTERNAIPCPGSPSHCHGLSPRSREAGCHYPDPGCSRSGRSSPAGLSQRRRLPQGRCARRHPRSGSTVAPGLVDQSPVGQQGSGPRAAVRELPGKRPEHIDVERGGCRQPAAASPRPNRGLGTSPALG